ncbi:hypothetical protein AcV5_005157 [Taiwanofungus camphoratus]|nr:hypothetical protein AcV5_005157 [Antrodia cinnamomea]
MDHHYPGNELDGETAVHSTKAIPTRFTFDDAFSDTDDNDASLEFSPAAIREELAKTMKEGASWHIRQDEAIDFASNIGYSVDPDASVSTFNIDAQEHDSIPSPPGMQRSLSSTSQMSSQLSESGSLHDVQLSNSFSQIALSDSSSSQLREEVDDHVAAYPAVQIDVSEPHTAAVEAKVLSDAVEDNSITSKQRAVSLEQIRARSVSPQPTTPRTSASIASVSSVQLPSSTSLPTPSSVKSTSSASSTFSQQRSARSVGPSALDKVISKTRPSFLPPKPRTEDRKHMQDWEAMMKRSRAAEEKRRKALQERRLARERKIEESITIWEREIVPDWTVVHRNPALKKLWWKGIPTKLRASMWQNAVGNALVLSKDAYKTCLSRAKRALASGSFPTTVLGLLEEDIKTTLPSLHLFLPEVGPLYQDLKDMLCAWVVARSDEGLGYVPGIAKIAAMLLINMPATQGFVVMRNLLERHCMRSFYGGMATRDDVEAYYRIFDTLLADGMPKIYFNFKQHQISPAAYLPDWLIPLFLDHLPFEACARIWDILLLEGDSFLYRAALAILAVLEPRLFFPDRRELLELLRGENRAAIEVAKRDGRPLNGAKYDVYGVDEEMLWERIGSMDEWWRESTWTRLIQRELPDL